MALLSTIRCKRCGKKSQESHSASDSPPDICGRCAKDEKDKALNSFLAELRELSTEQRISRIERELYLMATRPDPSRWDGRIG